MRMPLLPLACCLFAWSPLRADDIDKKYPLGPQLRVLAQDAGNAQYRELVLKKMLITDLAAEWQREATEDNAETFETWTIESAEMTETPDGRLLAVERWQVRGRDGIELDFEIVDIYTFRDGLVVRVDGFLDKTHAREAVGLSE